MSTVPGNAIMEALRTRAESSPDDVALVGQHEVVTYASLWHRVETLADVLRVRGVYRAGLWGENSVAWVVADLAGWHAGVVLVPLPAFFSASQLRHVMESAQLGHVIACGDAPAAAPALETIATCEAGVRLERISRQTPGAALADGTCKITFTSGTSGAPKGVCLDAAMLESVTRALAARIHAAEGTDGGLRVHFTMLPLSTLLENVAGVYVPLLLGKRIVVRAGADIGLSGSSGLNLPTLLHCLQRDRPNSLIVLPQILQALVAAAESGMALPDSLRFVAVGGATTSRALLFRAQGLGIPVFEGYGLSECASVVALNAPGANSVGSVGRVLDHVRVRIRGGAIAVAGNTFAGYLGQPARARDEWLDTGDLGHFDHDGYLHITGRRKDVIISSYGRNVSPEWVEGELSMCASIAQVMVVGDAQPFLSAIVVASRNADAAAIARDIIAVNAGLPDYARVKHFVVADEPFSIANHLLTANGRLRRDRIAARHTDQLAAGRPDLSFESLQA